MHTLNQARELTTNTAKNLRAILHEMNQIPAGCPVPPDMHRAILGELCTFTATQAEMFAEAAPDVIVRNISASAAPFVVVAPEAPAPAPEAPAAPEASPAAPGA